MWTTHLEMYLLDSAVWTFAENNLVTMLVGYARVGDQLPRSSQHSESESPISRTGTSVVSTTAAIGREIRSGKKA
jgi:hypothetical protein